MDVEKDLKDYFKKFYNMKPYLFIDEKEWKHIMETYEKSKAMHERITLYASPIKTIIHDIIPKPALHKNCNNIVNITVCHTFINAVLK